MSRKWIILLLVAAVIAAFVIWSRLQPDAVVEVIQPHRETLRAFVEEQAVTELPQDVLVATPIAGWLERIDLREGDPVTKGQVVARLETADLEDRVRQAEQRIAVLETEIRETQDNRLETNALVQARAIVKAMDETVQAAEKQMEASKAVADFAESEVERIRAIREANAAAAVELRQAETNWRRAQAEYQSDALQLAALKTMAAVSYIGPKFILDWIDRKSFDRETYQQQLEEARLTLQIEKRNLERAVIESPIEGVVLERHQTRRQYLQAGTPLLTLGRLDDMEIVAEVLTQRAMLIEPGDPVEIYGEGIPEGPLDGKVLRVYPAGFKKISSLGVEQQRVDVAIQLTKRPPKLGVDYRVNVRIYYDAAPDALVLPRTALFRGPQGDYSPPSQGESAGDYAPPSQGGVGGVKERSPRWQAMVVRDGRTRLANLRVGLMNDDLAQILEGVTPDDQVVARPSHDITPRRKVETGPE
ncbi:MAG: hypothetical protein AMXMBFR13_39720 [Phycisphaerae bacterium]